MRVGAFQFDVRRDDVEANLARVEEGVALAVREGLELVVLPEMWPTSFADGPAGPEGGNGLGATHEALERVRALSADLGLVVCGSAFGASPAGESDRPRNRLHVFDRGERVLSHDKVHLFSPTAEAESFSAGDEAPATVEVRGIRLSGVVCYDVRFGALLRAPWLDGAELLVVPAQWPDTRARHWRALIVGRAVEHQAFVVGANRTGHDVIGRRRLELAFPGNSLVVGPHGDVLAEGEGETGLVAAEIDPAEVRSLRRRVPVRRDERSVHPVPPVHRGRSRREP